MINERSRDAIAELVQNSVDDGARVVTGATVPDRTGYFYSPTVLSEVPPGSSILSAEIFGPVAPIVTFEDADEAVTMANDTEYGLISYVYTSDLAQGMRVAEALEAGMIALNRGVVSDPAAPFGGWKHSGVGREGGREGIYEYLETKYIGVSW